MHKFELIPERLAVIKLDSLKNIEYITKLEFFSISKTDQEISVILPLEHIPKEFLKCESGFRAIRVIGELNFNEVGVLSSILDKLAAYKISVFVFSTFNTDYIMFKEEQLEQVILILDGKLNL